MIDLGAVGARFTILDEASPALTNIMRQLEKLDAMIKVTKEQLDTFRLGPGVNRALTRMESNFAKVSQAAAKAQAGITTNFEKIDGVLANTQRQIGALAGEMKMVSGPTVLGGRTRPGVPSGGGPRAPGGSHGGGGPSIGGPSFGLPGGSHANLGHGVGTATLAALGYGVYLESQLEDVAAKALMTGQIKVDAGMTKTGAFKEVRDTIQGIVAKTGYSPHDVGEAILTTERQFGGLDFHKRLDLEKLLIPYAASEARMKESTLPEAFEAMVGLSHMTGTYDPAKLPELMRQFQYASMITPVKIPQFRNALSYSMPMLKAGLDMDPSSIMFLTAMTQTAGITNTKSGTWLRSFFENAEPRMGGSKTDIAHNVALHEMGLLDNRNNVSWQVKGQDGKVDWDKSILKMSEIINKFTTDTDPATRLSTIRQAFGERGGGFAALMNLKEFIEQFPVLQKQMKSFQGGDDVLKNLQEASPVQQARTAWGDLQNVLMDLGSSVLPPLTGALHGFDEALKAIKATTGENAGNKIIGGGLIAGALAWWNRAKLPGVAGKAGQAISAGAENVLGLPTAIATFLADLAAKEGAWEKAHPEALKEMQRKSTGSGLWKDFHGPEDNADWQKAHGLTQMPDALKGAAEQAIKPIGPAINGELTKIPGAVNPTVKTAFSQIESAIVGAINGLAASVAAAARAIPKVAAPTGEKHAAVYLDRHRVGTLMEESIVRRHSVAMATNDFDGRAGFTPVDMLGATG